MREIIPAIIPKDFYDLQAKMSLVRKFVPLIQIDVMDGKLTPEPSWPYNVSYDKDFQEIAKEKKGFPHWEGMDFEADLMVLNPFTLWQDWFNAGAKRIIFHIESKTNWPLLIEEFKKHSVGKDLPFYTEIGFAIDIGTPNEVLSPIIVDADFVQCMGIEHIGFQGEPFDERVIEKIKQIKKSYPEILISVDGGVSLDSAEKLISAGADRLVAGSAIFGSENVEETIEEFQNLLK
ncbi:MAG: hypothetical protein U1D31_01755 [Patescibacteria group bacterium]|nr:hypothetical protein [bacterium]MDZ4240831.1 hypothetical protein [Patescibacteria group bacterium]